MAKEEARMWMERAALVPNPAELAAKLRDGLGLHPIRQSDPRVRGLMVEMSSAVENRERLARELPALAEVLRHVGDSNPPLLVLAVNENPPSHADRFQLMPHVDRRYCAGEFTVEVPRRTTVVIIDFPADGEGGELVLFEEERLRAHAPASRECAREAVKKAGGVLLPPVPGTAYELRGAQPHAVLGYTASEAGPWRLVVVVAEFTLDGQQPESAWKRYG